MKFHILAAFLLLAGILNGQEKKALTFDEMLSWNSIKKSEITNNGEFVVYELSPLKGDPQVIVYNTKKQQSDTLKITSGIYLSPDGKFLVTNKKVPYAEMRQAKLDKVKKKDMPKDSVLVYHFTTGEKLVFPKADSILVSQKEGILAGILFEKEKEEEPADTTAEEEEPIEEEGTETTPLAAEEEIEQETEAEATDTIAKPKALGKCLVIYNGETGDTLEFKSVSEFSLSAKGNRLAFVESYEIDSLRNSTVKIWHPSYSEAKTLFTANGDAKKLTIDEKGSELAFLFSPDTSEVKHYGLFLSADLEGVQLIADSTTTGMPEGWEVNENGKLAFSEDGTMLYLGTNEIERKEPKDTLTDDEKPKLDLWSWTDKRLQPQQLVELKKDQKKTYTAVWHVNENKLIQLTDESYSDINFTPKRNSTMALLEDESPYLRESNWTGLWRKDLTAINVKTGDKKEVSKGQFSYQFSRGGNYVMWFCDADTSLYAHSIASGKTINISSKLPYKIWNEQEDHPIIPRPYGTAGWSSNDEFVLIYDRYDIWKVDPDGNEAPICITNGYGRDHEIYLRYVDLDRENEFIDLKQPILLKGHNSANNKNYFFELNVTRRKAFHPLFEGDCMVSTPRKAAKADQLLWTKQSFTEYPDLIVSNLNFNKNNTISKANPQQEEYLWGTVEKVNWISFRGEKLDGLLYKPEQFDPNKKYPMLVYFYERNYEMQHRHRAPAPSRSVINPTFYTSNDYLVFIPDITYVDGYPGQSAYDCIVSGVQSLTTQYEWIDAAHMGLQGQSWGGYQTAYLVTQTDLFAAAMGGAVVSNMTSAYGGIRWQTGLNRMFQYEKTQSRIGGTLWEKPLLYIENSPLFHAPKVTTPLLLMHNDNDGAVPWYQGIEYFVALRRLNKPVWMLNYNGQPHNLSAGAVADRLDLSMRMKQFFDHYLKGEPAPEWMTEGIPAVDKGKKRGY